LQLELFFFMLLHLLTDLLLLLHLDHSPLHHFLQQNSLLLAPVPYCFAQS
jgi:hypothetical protein